MPDPQTRDEIVAQLQHVQANLTNTVQAILDEQFDKGTPDSWSAAGYLKHLILSIKPFAKALNFPKEQLQKMFGTPDHPSRTYADLVALYKARLSEGVRAENYEAITPVVYRLPEDLQDLKAYLLDVWNDSNNRLLTALQAWDDAELDAYQIPHPAIGLLTIREMLFFTVHHNTLHWHDIEQASVTA
jgi:uncharacterized damage-inducible protein DinB